MTKIKTAQKLMYAGWVVLILMGVVLALVWNNLPPQVPWFYSLIGGEQQLVNKIVLAGVIGGMAVILGITRILASWAGKGDTPAETTLMVGALMSILLLAAGFFRVIQIFAL